MLRFFHSLVFVIVACLPAQGNCAIEILSDCPVAVSPFFTTKEITGYELLLNATFEHISVHLAIEGDVNLNSLLQIEYRLKGTSTFLAGADAMRAHPTMIVDGNALNKNFHAGSALFLQPNTVYELKLTLMDSDGGGSMIDTSFSTKKFPEPFVEGNLLYVAPGNGGGAGTSANPYLGIQAAVDVVQPGDIIQVASGTYAPFSIATDGTAALPISIRSEQLHGAIIDGGGINTGIVTIGNFNDSTQYIILDGFEITNGRWGIDAQNTQQLTVRNNKINNVDYGFVNRRENGWEHNQWIDNNWIVGTTSWPATGIPGERGVDLRGNNNVVSHNTISDFGDGISTDGAAYDVSYALDIHNNNITRIVDDMIEVDGMVSNSRIYNNQGYNARAGVSVAPVFGGPVYIFRNVFYNLELSGIKMNRSPAGLYVVNNTFVSDLNALSSPAGWQNTFLKNNAIVCSRYCFEEYGLVTGSVDDWDYNGYKSTRAGTAAEPWFKWDNVKYENVTDLANNTTIETNAVSIDFSDFVNVFIPTPFTTEIFPSATDLLPTAGSALLDAGIAINNLDLPYVSDGNPDIGALEYGNMAPSYGHDFDAVCSYSDLAAMTWLGAEGNGWFSPNNWSPCGIPNKNSNVIVETGALHYPVINTDVSIKSLTVKNLATVTVLDGSTLFVEN